MTQFCPPASIWPAKHGRPVLTFGQDLPRLYDFGVFSRVSVLEDDLLRDLQTVGIIHALLQSLEVGWSPSLWIRVKSVSRCKPNR
jgi:hypothetical protein